MKKFLGLLAGVLMAVTALVGSSNLLAQAKHCPGVKHCPDCVKQHTCAKKHCTHCAKHDLKDHCIRHKQRRAMPLP